MKRRKDDEEPYAVSRKGWRYHHVGIPTTAPHPDERYLEHLKIFVRGFGTSPFGIEWMRFEPDCQINNLVRSLPHVAFEVDNIERAVRGYTLLGAIASPSPGVRAAMIVHGGAPVELIEFSRPRGKTHPKRSHTRFRHTLPHEEEKH